jgi:hypothetical protein
MGLLHSGARPSLARRRQVWSIYDGLRWQLDYYCFSMRRARPDFPEISVSYYGLQQQDGHHLGHASQLCSWLGRFKARSRSSYLVC